MVLVSRAALGARTLAAALVAAAALVGTPAAASATEQTHYDTPVSGCAVDDQRTTEISGAVATDDGWLVVNDKSYDVWSLDAQCRVTRFWHGETPKGGADVEDLMRGPDGTLWLADTGGNRLARQVAHVVGLTTDGEVVDMPLRLPRPGLDIEAAVVTPQFELVMVTKSPGTAARVLTAPLPTIVPTEPVTVTDRGSLDLRTVHGVPPGGRYAVTGAALSPDGGYLALRTPTDVYELDVTAVDVADALLSQTPAWVGRVLQPQGEAISYTPGIDRLSLLSERRGSTVATIGLERANTDALTIVATPRWVLYTAVEVLPLVLFVWLLARRRGRRVGSVVVAGLVLSLGLALTFAAAGLRAPGYRSVAVVSFAPRDPVGMGADALVLLGPRYVAMLGNPDLVQEAAVLLGRPDLSAAADISAVIEPGTINLEIQVESHNPDLSARAANALAGLVQDAVSRDPLVYARRSALALPAGSRELPSANDVALLGGFLSVAGALTGGFVWTRRRPLGATTRTGAQPADRSEQ